MLVVTFNSVGTSVLGDCKWVLLVMIVACSEIY